MGTENDFLQKLRATFALEAEEHLQVMATGLLALEKSSAPGVDRRVLDEVFRAAHSLKGAARAVDLTDIEGHCQSLEDLFAAWKRQPGTLLPAALDAAHRTLEVITTALRPSGRSPERVRRPIQTAASALPPPAAVAPDLERTRAEERPVFSEGTVRIAVAKLAARLLQAEEMLNAKLALDHRAGDLRELASGFDTWRTGWTAVEPDVRAARQALQRASTTPGGSSAPGLARMLDFFDSTVVHLESASGRVAALARSAESDRQVLGRLVDDLLEGAKDLLLMPFATLAAPLPKLVRDLCRDLGKEADLVIRGEDIEIDKRILEKMKDPLIHLLRNSLDHGIETPGERLQSGKPPRGTVTVGAWRVGSNRVELVVSDDGRGIDIERVKAAAVERAVLSDSEARELNDTAAKALIFNSDVSTAPIITRISGRGLGLAIVQEHAEALGGTVSVESRPQKGVRFSIVLPTTLATFRGVLVQTAGQWLVVPSLQVERVTRVAADEIRTVEGRDTIVLAGRTVSLVHLADVLELPRADLRGGSPAALVVVVLGSGDGRIAFAVDAVLDEQEVLVKPLQKPLSRVRNIAGATVLGSGGVALILNAADLLKSARKAGNGAIPAAAGGPLQSPASKSILVAEDSITSRTLIKNILETAGYTVETAVDGMEAFTRLRAGRFDLLVSDVEMPRLNGFDLTARVRADARLSELPVVLVTALETTDDRARGIDAGADAYIVKSSFDQSNLLDAVRRLV